MQDNCRQVRDNFITYGRCDPNSSEIGERCGACNLPQIDEDNEAAQFQSEFSEVAPVNV